MPRTIYIREQVGSHVRKSVPRALRYRVINPAKGLGVGVDQRELQGRSVLLAERNLSQED